MASRSDEGSSPPQVLVSNIDAFDKLPEDPTVDEYKAAIAQVNLAELEERVDEVKDSWETDSLYDDLIIEVGADAIADDDDDGEYWSSCLGVFCCPLHAAIEAVHVAHHIVTRTAASEW